MFSYVRIMIIGMVWRGRGGVGERVSVHLLHLIHIINLVFGVEDKAGNEIPL